ncbi:MAG: formate--tetrahydrofolate ligase [Acidimicrobiaceae bacterium]|nr:formate--tetrahydrofolate ligase [Acidimicrobiaceae bacterium]MCS5674394.1 formate--tetrahydrofolate ligase [Acidimicrobiales bacterium]MEE2806017.1 formate--tetrahydrofolate ligase [Actinomycetota bacterium]|tara:strand:- start:1576 stop:3273 length:1698 start_codon:yes stop_codon:yes gene_type:complete
MEIPSDLEIASQASLLPLSEVASNAGIPLDYLEFYGKGAAKIQLEAIPAMAERPFAKYVVVSAITPTPLGEGKTTTTVGLGQAFQHIGRSATIAIRQPSMGPTFGIKGGAAGGGYSQVVPMELFNLHLTGDMHAVTAAHNMCAAVLDAHLYHGNDLEIDIHNISWRRVVDINDRALRNVTIGLGGSLDGIPRESGFDITAASEVMAALALATSLQDLRARMGRVVVGYTKDGTPVTAEDLGVAGSMTVILREAIKPNLMQTLEGTPALVHTGPFGNIATGNSSIVADQIGIRTGDFLLTEAGFGADMGAERFFNIKCRYSGLAPDAAVLVATVRGLKAHSGNHRIVAGRPLPEALLVENPDEVHAGGDNLRKQLENMRIHGVTPVVAINTFPGDHEKDLEAIAEIAAEYGARSALCTHFAEGGRGATELAEALVDAAAEESQFSPLYPDEMDLRNKIRTVAQKIYGAEDVSFTARANKQLDGYERNGFGNLPVCIAKTHLSISSDPKLVGAPTGWTLPVREVRASVGAGFVYPICGDMRTMPGLGKTPAAKNIDIDAAGNIIGLS